MLVRRSDPQPQVAGRIVSCHPPQGREDVRSLELELLAPGTRIHRRFEHFALDRGGAAVARDLRTDRLLPALGEPHHAGRGVETEIAEHLGNEASHGLEFSAAPTPQRYASSSVRNTSPVGSLGWKKVDFCGITSPASVVRKTSSGANAFRYSAVRPCPARRSRAVCTALFG